MLARTEGAPFRGQWITATDEAIDSRYRVVSQFGLAKLRTMNRRLTLLIGTGILQALGIFIVVGLALLLQDLVPGTSALQNALFLFFVLILLAVGVGLFLLGHLIRRASRR